MVTKCPNCGATGVALDHLQRNTRVNPNNEYVEGYGHVPVNKFSGPKLTTCIVCQWKEDHNQTKIDIDGNILGIIGEEDEQPTPD